MAELDAKLGATEDRRLSLGSDSADSGISKIESEALAEARELSKTQILDKRRQHISRNLILAYENTDPLYIKSGEGCYSL